VCHNKGKCRKGNISKEKTRGRKKMKKNKRKKRKKSHRQKWDQWVLQEEEDAK
jgi:hypothetical protein